MISKTESEIYTSTLLSALSLYIYKNIYIYIHFAQPLALGDVDAFSHQKTMLLPPPGGLDTPPTARLVSSDSLLNTSWPPIRDLRSECTGTRSQAAHLYFTRFSSFPGQLSCTHFSSFICMKVHSITPSNA